MSEQPILEMNQVTVAGASATVTGLTDISVALMPGELLVLEPERHVDTVSFYDVASGLIAPDDGVVCFCGEDWQRMGLFSQSAARGRIGRMFEVEGWVSNLNIFENIALSQRHHTLRSDRKLRQAIEELFERIGLRDCLAERPHVLSRGDLRRAQWARAFLGEAALLLLNTPLLDVRPENQSVLIELASEARARGAAVVWTSRDASSWSDREGFKDAAHGTFSGGRLQMSNPG